VAEAVARRDASVRSSPTASRSDDLDERFYHVRAAFSVPRFKALYKALEQDGEPTLAAPALMRSATPWRPEPARWRSLNSAIYTAISFPWLPSPETIVTLTAPMSSAWSTIDS
jgi:hypothetical protein